MTGIERQAPGFSPGSERSGRGVVNCPSKQYCKVEPQGCMCNPPPMNQKIMNALEAEADITVLKFVGRLLIVLSLIVFVGFGGWFLDHFGSDITRVLTAMAHAVG